MAAAQAQAETMQVAVVDPLTITATRTATPLSEAPATVTVIERTQIEDALIKDVKDLTRWEPGVSVRSAPARFTAAGASTGRDGNAGFNIRGLEGNRVLIQVDGVRAPDAYSFGAQNMGRGDYVDLDVLKSVEIVRGPASALYGSDGLAGAVSFITNDPADLLQDGRDWFVNAKAGYASADESWAESLVAGGRQGPWEAMLAYTRRDGEGTETQGRNRAPNIDRTVPNPEDNQSNAVLAKLIYAPSEAHRFRFTFDHLDRDIDWTVLSAIAKPPVAATGVIGMTALDRVERNRYSLDYRYAGDGWIEASQAAVYYQTSETRQFSAEDRFTAPDRTRDATFDNEVWGLSLQAESLAQTGAITHRFVYGADYSMTRQEGVRDGTVPPAGETFPTRAFPATDSILGGVFLQDEIGILDGRLVLYPAIRWDYYEISPEADRLFTAAVPASQSDSHFTPKLGVVFKATDQVTLFANLASGFKAPSPSQVNNGFTNPVSNYRSISNPNLKPETSETAEVGVRFNTERLSLSGAVFTGSYKDFIDQVQVAGAFTPTNPAVYQFINLGKVRISGVEARGRAELGAGFTLQAAAAYTRGTQTQRGIKAPLDTVDPFKLVVGLGWKEGGGRYGGQLVATHSAQKDRGRISQACTPACFTGDAFTVLDLTGYWRVTDRVTARACVFNLTDETYWWWSDIRGLSSTSTVLDAYSQPGRNVSVSLSLKL
jgi:hemoglobin/transferrin/lactoferrin receptor protein